MHHIPRFGPASGLVKASIEPNASEAYLCSASAWGLKEGCERDLKKYNTNIGITGSVMVVLGLVFLLGIWMPAVGKQPSMPWFALIVSVVLLGVGAFLAPTGFADVPDPDDEKTRIRIYKKLGIEPPTKAEMAAYSFAVQSGV